MKRILCLCVVAVSGCLTLSAQELKLVAKDPDGHGLLCMVGDKRVLIVDGTPEQMGGAHGRLLADLVPQVMPRTMALVATGYAIQKGEWFYDHIDDIYHFTT